MKTKFYAFAMLIGIASITSCEKNSEVLSEKLKEQTTGSSSAKSSGSNASPDKVILPNETCPETFTQLTAGQFYNAGSVSVTNDASYIYVTYTTANGYLLTQTHLYVGNCAGIPVNSQGNPMPGQFPYSGVHANETSYTYQVPISTIAAGSCGCIAAHAVVVRLDAAGNVIEQQTGWGQGYRINPRGGNWGMAFGFCSCVLPSGL